MARTLAEDLCGTGISAASANVIADALTELGSEAIPDSEKGQPNGVATLDGDGKVPNVQLHLGEDGGPAGPLDGTGKIPASQLPPLEHDVGEAVDQAGMLALDVTAPAMCVRTDFTPPHIFILTADPASTLANWHDTGELGAGGANPSATVGLTAKNGVANSFMRSDGAPAIDQTIAPTWSGLHTFSGGTLMTGAAYFNSTTGATTPKIISVGDALYIEVADGSRLSAINAQAFIQGFLMPHSGGIAFPEYTSFDFDTAGMTFVSDTQWSLVLNNVESLRVDTSGSEGFLKLPDRMEIQWSDTGMDGFVVGLAKIGASGLLGVVGNGMFASLYETGQASGAFTWENSTKLTAATDGTVLFKDNAGTSFNRLMLGGTSNAFPAIKRNGAALESRLADDSNFSVLRSANPVAANDVVNKGFSDGAYRAIAAGNSLIYATSPTGTQITIPYAATAATPNTIVERAADGTITINPPSAELHAANKGYVDPRMLTAAAVTAIGALTTIATADANDPASTMALVNECKAKINGVIAALKAA